MDTKLTSQNRWDVMESVNGTYTQNQVQNDMVEIRFNRPISIREHRRYAIRLCSQGSKTCFGDSGVSSLRGPCGAIFSFYPCDLSFNGTTPNRGQLPSILYYSLPRGKDGVNGKIIGEIHARDIALQISREIADQSIEILKHVREFVEGGYYTGKVNQAPNMHCVDSEHNITPIEEHLDVSCSHKPEFMAESSSMSQATRELTKKFESFTKNIVETLKSKTNPFECEIATDAAGQNTAEPNRNEPYMPFYRHQPHHPQVSADDEEQDAEEDDEDIGESSHLHSAQWLEVFNQAESALFHTLLPAVMALVGPLVSDPQSTVQILTLIRQVLPHVAALNQQEIMSSLSTSPANSPNEYGEEDLLNENHAENIIDVVKKGADKAGRHLGTTTSNHYCVVESDHPYKSASISTYRIQFPPCVQWFTIEFDPQCGTVQPDDYLNVSIPIQSLSRTDGFHKHQVPCDSACQRQGQSPSISMCSMDNDNAAAAAHKQPSADYDSDDWIVLKKLNG